MTEQEIKEEVAQMIELLAEEDGPKKVESRILSHGRTNMQHILAFLLVRYVDLSIQNTALKEGTQCRECNGTNNKHFLSCSVWDSIKKLEPNRG